MHKDTREALERLERELLAEEKPQLTDDDLDLLIDDILFDDEYEEEAAEPLPNYANSYRSYNSDRTDLDLDGYSDEVYEEPAGGKGELIFSMVMLGLISLVMIVWAVSLL